MAAAITLAPGTREETTPLKFVDELSETLRFELAAAGITVLLIEPGVFETGFAGNMVESGGFPEDHFDRAAAQRFEALIRSAGGAGPGNPQEVVDAVLEAIDHPDGPFRRLVGQDAEPVIQLRRGRALDHAGRDPAASRSRRGHIVQVSSQGGIVAFPTVGIYHASKWALEGLTDALANEVGQFGIKTTLIEPGGYGTDWGGASATHSDPNPLHQPIHDVVSGAAGGTGKPPASATVGAVLAAVDADEPPTRLLLGSSAYNVVLTTYEQRLQTWRDWETVTRSADAD